MNYTVLTILPSGAYDLIRTNNQNMDFDTIIGPIIDPDDIEKATVYYIYCKMDNSNDNENFINTTLTKIVNKKNTDLIVYGQGYVLKVIDKKTEDINKNDIDIILCILQTLFDKNNNQSSITRINNGPLQASQINDDNEKTMIEWVMNLFCM